MEKYSIIRRLATGRQGSVFLIKDCQDEDKQYAMKTMTLLIPKDVFAETELKCLKQLDHPNIIKCHDSFISSGIMYIIMDYCEEGCLADMIENLQQQKGTLCTQQYYDFHRQIASALNYTHTQNIIHRDFWLENMFLCNGQIKIGDFGIAKILSNPSERVKKLVGTPNYKNFEFPNIEQNYSFEVDNWCMGHCFKLLYTVKPSTLRLRKEEHDPFSGSYGNWAELLIYKLLLNDPRKRWTAIQAVQYLDSIDI